MTKRTKCITVCLLEGESYYQYNHEGGLMAHQALLLVIHPERSDNSCFLRKPSKKGNGCHPVLVNNHLYSLVSSLSLFIMLQLMHVFCRTKQTADNRHCFYTLPATHFDYHVKT